MAKNVIQLTARTATADSDILHVNSGGTDYKQTKANFTKDIPHMYTDTVAAGSSKSFTLGNNTYLLVMCTGTAAGRNAVFNVFCGSAGAMYTTDVLQGANIVVTTATNTLTIQNTTSGSGSTYVCAVIFSGSMTAA